VLLLQLAEALLEQAERSPAARVPVVFNLASWAQTRKPIFDWMNEELKRFYDVRARKALERWMKNDALIFLFDGLDEVKEEARAACLEALNAFQAQHKPPMVVCSRVTDYESLPQKLNLKSAILLKPLSQAQVDQFLAAGSLTRLKRLVESDAVVQEMSRNPFLLNTMAYAYDDSNPDLQGMSRPRDPAERREHLFDAYIRRRFAESLRKPYDLDDTLRYLRFLAKNMQAYSQTIFRPELIDERWLDEALPEWIKKDVVKNTVRSATIWLIISSVGLIVGLSLKIAWWLVLFGILLCSIVLSVTVSSWQLFERPFERLQFNAKRLWIAFRIRRKRLIPSNLQAFIHFTITLKIMRAYGGGFVFAHRYLRETLAGLDGAAVLAKRASKDSEAFAQLVEMTEQTPDILISLLKHEDSDVRRIAAKALGTAKGAQAVEPLIARLSDGNWDVRRAAAESLHELAWQPQTEEQRVAYSIAKQSWNELVQIGAPAVEPLIARLGDAAWDVRRAAAEALGRLGDARAVEPLIARLGDDNWNVRRAAAEALVKIGAPAVEPLIARLSDADGSVRRAAAEALVKIGAPAVEPLIVRLGDADGSVRRAAAEALGQLGDARAVEPLIVRLGDADGSVRRAAAEALGRLGDARAVEPLIKRLGDADGSVRRAAAEALVKIGVPAVEPLIACLGDANGM
jgi:HEAT repeat protein